VVKPRGKPITGRLSITRNRLWTPPGFTSSLEPRFSLSAGYKGGPFRDVAEVRDAALARMPVGPSQIGVVECEDKEYERATVKFERFREVDAMAVPASIEWVTLLHRDIVANMGVDLRRAKAVSGVQVGRSGDYWWVVLGPEPFGFAGGVGVSACEQVSRKLGLEAIQSRFKRASP
jgi:hypothetical protein